MEATTGPKEIAIEVVRCSDMHTLSEAGRNDTLSDVIGVHRSVIEARLGRDIGADIDRATKILATAVEDALDDDADEDDVIEYIKRRCRG